jgi:hypothetical protein
MKKIFKIALILGGCLLIGTGCATIEKKIVYAGEIENTSEIVSSEITTTTSSSELTQEEVEKTIKEKIENWASEYVSWDYVSSIINWSIDTGLLSVIALLVVKTRKYKSMTGEEIVNLLKSQLIETLTTNFKEMSEEQLKQLVLNMDELSSDIEVMKKALVLAQDKTAEGKIALLNLIDGTTENKETKEAIDEQKEKIEKEEAKIEEVKSAVDGDYKEIF